MTANFSLEFFVALPHTPCYWGPDATQEEADVACALSEEYIEDYVEAVWPGASCRFLHWCSEGGLPPVVAYAEDAEDVEVAEACADRLAQFVEDSWLEWAQEAADLAKASAPLGVEN